MVQICYFSSCLIQQFKERKEIMSVVLNCPAPPKPLSNYPPQALTPLQKSQQLSTQTLSALQGQNGHTLTRCSNSLQSLVKQHPESLQLYLEQYKKSILYFISKFSDLLDRQLQHWTRVQQFSIVQRLEFFCTNAMFESTNAKKIPKYRLIHEEALVSTKIIHKVMRLEFRVYVREVLKPLGLLVGNVSKSTFTQEERMMFKPNILRMLSVVTDNTVRYWYILSLHRIVEEKNVTLKEMEEFGIYKVLLDSISLKQTTQQVRYALRVITMFGQAYGSAVIDKFFQQGLMQRTIYFMEIAPKMTFNFLQKLHDVDFSRAFPHRLTEHLLTQSINYDPTTQLDHMKAAMRICRHRLVHLTKHKQVREVDFLTPLENGLLEKVCYVLRQPVENRLKLYTYNFVKDLLVMAARELREMLPVLINQMINEGMLEQVREDMTLESFKGVAIMLHKMLIAGHREENFVDV